MSGGIKALLTGGQQVAYYPALARAVGGIAPALFLQQLAHWSGKSNDGWVFRKQEELEEELAMSSKVQANARNKLCSLGIIEEERRSGNKLHYRIVWEELEQVVSRNSQREKLPKGETRNSQREKLETPDGQFSNNRDKSKKESKQYSRRDADASRSQGKTEEKEDKPNWTTVAFEHFNKVGLAISPEDRKRLPGNLLRCYTQENATDIEMHRLITHLVERRLAGYVLSPQDALNDIRGVRSEPNGTQNDTPTYMHLPELN